MKFILLIITSFLLISTYAQQNFALLNIYFDSIEKYHLFSGSVALQKEGKELYSRQFGVVDASLNQPNNENTKFRIGSISKIFTATMILQSVEKKKIKLNTKLNKFFPSITNSKNITIEHLLRHTAGIFNYTMDAEYWKRCEQEISKEDLLEIIAKYPSNFKPGSKYEYSNSGYFILALILEKIHKKSYDEILKEFITNPLQLVNTYEGTSISPQNNEAYPVKYSFANDKWKNNSITHSSHLLGAGGILSTPTELNQFMEALMNGKIISEKSLNQMKTLKFDYGLGIMTFPYYLHVAYGHNGGVDTYSSVTGYFEKEKVCFSLVTNGYEGNTNDISVAMLAAYFGNEIKMPKSIVYKSVQDDILKKYEGKYYNEQYKINLEIIPDFEEKTIILKFMEQPKQRLTPVSSSQFVFEIVDAKLNFYPEEDKLILHQYGNKLEFKKIQ